jgi:hypothetical protein
MTQDEIIEMARQFCPYQSEELRGAYYDGFMKASKLVAQHERERIFGELIKMHEIASSRHNYYLNAVLTIRARGLA